MMTCKKCNGRIYIDRVFSQKLRIEIYCLSCGKRWFVKKDGNAFGEWLNKIEKGLGAEYCIFT
jgi:NAD-dependent SIR2 family protein deacetylase